MKLPNSISVKLIGFLLALCIPPFLLYQVLTFSIVRSTISGMALQHSMDLLADREAYLKHQLDRIEDLLRLAMRLTNPGASRARQAAFQAFAFEPTTSSPSNLGSVRS